jgi:hypothetical protein
VKRIVFSLLIGFASLGLATFLVYVKWTRGDILPWQTGYAFWPGSFIAVGVDVARNGQFFGDGQFFGEGWGDILVVSLAEFWIAALSNLVFYSGLAYLLIGLLAKKRPWRLR